MPVKSRLLVILTLSLTLLTLTSITCCELDYKPTDEIELIGFNLYCMNNSALLPERITDGKCPSEAFMLIATPLFDIEPDENFRYFLKSNVIDISIITKNAFSINHPAGSDISDLFRRYPVNIGATPIQWNAPFGRWLPNAVIGKVLMAYPDKGSTHSFIVKIELENGTILSQETQPITFY